MKKERTAQTNLNDVEISIKTSDPMRFELDSKNKTIIFSDLKSEKRLFVNKSSLRLDGDELVLGSKFNNPSRILISSGGSKIIQFKIENIVIIVTTFNNKIIKVTLVKKDLDMELETELIPISEI